MPKKTKYDESNSYMLTKKAGDMRSSTVLVQEGGEVKNVPNSIEIIEFDIHDDVRITPSYMQFKDGVEGMTFQALMTIQNTGKKSAHIRICAPNSIALRIKTLEQGCVLNPGLRILRWVHYSFRRPSLLHAMIPISINGTMIDYHVICTLAMEHINIKPHSIDFGIVDIGCSSGVKLLTVMNDGGKSTKFSVDLGTNDMEIDIKPMKGIVRPQSSVDLKVELIGTAEGVYYSEFWIKSTPNIRVTVKVNIILPRLVVYHPNTTGDFTLIDFPTTFIDTQRYDTAILRNLSSQFSNFVVLGEIGHELVSIQTIDTKKNPAYRVFKIRPMEGRMEPFGGLIFNIVFSPSTKVMKAIEDGRETKCEDFMAFVRILRIHCTEVEDIIGPDHRRSGHSEESVHGVKIDGAASESLRSSSDTFSNQESRKSVRLCLHGEIEKAHLLFVPDELHLGDIAIGESTNREVRIKNPSMKTAVKFQYIPNFTARCQPANGRIKANGSLEVLITVTSSYNVQSPVNLAFDVIVRSCSATDSKEIISVKGTPCSFKCWINPIGATPSSPKTTFNCGITNEVSEFAELSTLESKKSAYGKLLRADLISDSIPAYPNDMAKSMRPWTGPPVRSLFTGKLRYMSDSHYEETLSPQETAFKALHRNYWSEYLRTIKSGSTKNAGIEKSEMFQCGDEFEDLYYAFDIPKVPSRSMARTTLKHANSSKMMRKAKDEMLVPLSPLQIYNVKVSPTMFTYGAVNLTFAIVIKSGENRPGPFSKDVYNFNAVMDSTVLMSFLGCTMVALHSVTCRLLTIENKNNFAVMVRLSSSVSKCISFPEGSLMILQSGTSTARLLKYHAEGIGKFNTYIDYIINDNHSFGLTITADVVRKSLSLDRREIVFGMKHLAEESHQPTATYIEIKNKLDARTAFKWDVPSRVCFHVEPMFGVVRGNRTLFVEVYYAPNISKSDVAEVVFNSEGGNYTNISLSMILLPMPKVAFINDTINFNKIPLNMMTTGIGILHNAEFTEVMFEVDHESMVLGCEVCPNYGTIAPRGIAALEVQLQFDACFEFSIAIRVVVQKCLTLQLKLCGQVSFPMLALSPETIQMRRISPDAIATHIISATNIGKTDLKIEFPLREYPEYRVSTSACRRDPGLDKTGITIEPGATQTVYLHFFPIDLASYDFYLPIVLNDILGPAVIEYHVLKDPFQYLKSRAESYSELPGITIIPLPSKLPSIHIDCTVAGHILKFSKLEFYFDVTSNKVNAELQILNKAHQDTSFIIRMDGFQEPGSPFFIRWLQGVRPTTEPLSIVCTLHPGEETFFLIEFKPSERGHFSLEAPIFVRDEMEGNAFNSLLLEGDYPMCSIECDTLNVYFSPIPLEMESEQEITLRISHFTNFAQMSCTILQPQKCSGCYEEGTLRVSFPNGNSVTGKHRIEEVEVSILFRSKYSTSFSTVIQFRDHLDLASCCIVVYATADNCALTLHAFLRVVSESAKSRRPEQPTCYSSITSDEENSFISKQVVYVRKHTDVREPRVGAHSTMSRISKNDVRSPQIEEGRDNGDGKGEAAINSKMFIIPTSLSKSAVQSNTAYPFFQSSSKHLDIGHHLQTTLKAAEEWMYSVPLGFNFYPCIVDGITGLFSGLFSIKPATSARRKLHSVKQSFVDVLVALMGESEVSKYIGNTTSLPEDEMERINYVLKLYENVLEFLSAQGACLAHVSPEFLLSYNDYSLSVRSTTFLKRSSTSILTDSPLQKNLPKQLFESRSKQCWMDTVLQSHKVLVLNRISMADLEERIASTLNRRSSEMTSTSSKMSCIKSSIDPTGSNISVKLMSSNTQSSPERILLSWLEHHFEQQRLEGWMVDERIILNPLESRDTLLSRTLNDFENDLSDGLVLIAVTAAYCPFLIEDYFDCIYIHPQSREEMHHNAICIVRAWLKIRLGFMIKPSQITQPSSVQMIMLVSYLFENLPSYLPRTKVKFSCPLTETITRQIAFTNTTGFSVDYVVQFMNNKSEFFTAVQPQSILHLHPRDSGHVKVQFHARKIQKTKAYLLMCGATIGPHFAKNHIFVLEGSTNHLGITNNYNLVSKLYQVQDEVLSIPVPYKEEISYDILVTEERPTKSALLKMTRWSELRLRKVPRRLFLNQKSIHVTENAFKANLSITVACIAPNPRKFWLIFQAKLGDFIIQISSEAKPTITDHITVEWNREECTCSDPPISITSACPLNINIPIPARNWQLWKCISQMFQKSLNPKERLFWSRHLDTNIGLRLIHWLMDDHTDSAAKECMHIFNTCVTYTTTMQNEQSPLTIPTQFTISDVRLPGKQSEMTIHIPHSTPRVHETIILLESLDKMEQRCYKVNFFCKTPAPLSKSLGENNKRRKRYGDKS